MGLIFSKIQLRNPSKNELNLIYQLLKSRVPLLRKHPFECKPQQGEKGAFTN